MTGAIPSWEIGVSLLPKAGSEILQLKLLESGGISMPPLLLARVGISSLN